jgi:hypothetical protein
VTFNLNRPPEEDRVDPKIRALVARGKITLTEINELRCNSWEWEAIIPALDDEAFVDRMQYALNNCFTSKSRPFSTYNDAVEGLYTPELLRRFKAAIEDARRLETAVERIRGALEEGRVI